MSGSRDGGRNVPGRRTGRSLVFRLLLPTTAAFLVSLVAGGLLLHVYLKRESLRIGQELARRVLERNLAIHRYFTDQLKPHVFRALGGVGPSVRFDPVWMSSTYAVREIDRYFREALGSPAYYYKECAINARSPANEADPFERSVLRRMAADPALEEFSDVRQIDGKSYFVYLRRGETMESTCLRCHSEPARAPSGLVETYGPSRSFGRHVGELVSAVSIRIPTPYEFEIVWSASRDLLALMAGLAAVLCGLQWWFVRRSVTKPLGEVRAGIVAISEDPARLGERIEPPQAGREIDELVDSFNRMTAAVKERREERTAEIIRANENLQREVAKRLEAEEQAREAADHFQALFEEAADSILLLRLAPGRPPTIEDINRAGLLLHGYEKAEIVGMEVGIFDGQQGSGLAQERLKALLEKGVIRFEAAQKTKDGRGIALEVYARLVDIGGVSHVLAVERDVSERHLLEERLRQAQKMEAIGTLAGGIAHDFNNILTPVMAHAELALLDLPESDPVRDDIEQILRGAERAADLVRQILMIARKGEEALTAVDVGSLVKEVTKFLRASLPATIEIVQEIDPSCRPAFAEPSQLQQVLLNLCTNARDAMAEGGGTLTVSVRPATPAEAAPDPEGVDRNWVRLAVEDTGSGIPPAVLGRIFEPYFTTKPVGKGTGLGLAVAHGIIASLGGEMHVQSREGAGTRFEILLPAAKEERAVVQETDPARPAGKGEHILLVDDEEAIVSVVQRIVEELGYRVTPFTSSEAALEAFRASPDAFDAVLTDQTMPRMTGLVLAEEILAVRPGMPVLLGTGYSDGLDEAAARAHGIRRLILKPYSRGLLAAVLRGALGDQRSGSP